jgi:hypothetical protein
MGTEPGGVGGVGGGAWRRGQSGWGCTAARRRSSWQAGAAGGEAVEVGGVEVGVAGAAEVGGGVVVGDEEEDVGRGRRGEGGAKAAGVPRKPRRVRPFISEQDSVRRCRLISRPARHCDLVAPTALARDGADAGRVRRGGYRF